MVLDLCEGGALFDQIRHMARLQKAFSERQAAKIVYQVASALEYLHKKNIVHRDLKPENIMFANPHQHMSLEQINIKIIDFGFAVQTPPDQLLTQPCGTP